MEINDWYDLVTGDDSVNAVAQKAGIVQTTLNRQVKAAKFTAEVVVSIARAYGAPILDALVTCGLISESEARLKKRIDVGLEKALSEATDSQLLHELLRRVNEDGGGEHPAITAPLDENHPDMQKFNESADIVPLRVTPLEPANIPTVTLTDEELALPAAAKKRPKRNAENTRSDQ